MPHTFKRRAILRIFLFDPPKVALGEEVGALFGWLILTKPSLTALSRQDVPEQERQAHILHADEVQNFIHGVDFPTILSEARKYRLTLAIATQTLNQLPEQSGAPSSATARPSCPSA